MSPTPLSPGVFIEEVPGGPRAIEGVATSYAAFIGRAPRGPANGTPVTVHSFSEFSHVFGALWKTGSLAFAVRDFFANGGHTAHIVRLYHAAPGTKARARLHLDGLALEAASPGAWGNALRARASRCAGPSSRGEETPTSFDLLVCDKTTGHVEEFRSVSTRPGHPRSVARVVEQESDLVRVWGSAPASPPDLLPNPAPGLDVWADNLPPTCVSVAPDDQASDGLPLDLDDFIGQDKREEKGLYALEKVELFNLLCIPPHREDGNIDVELISAAACYCEEKRAMLLVDPPATWAAPDDAKNGVERLGTRSKNAAVFFPRLRQPNPLSGGRMETFAPCGAVAGVIARTDAEHGVWKAPAGLDARLVGVPELAVMIRDVECGMLNSLAVNCLRVMPGVGPLIWAARTLEGYDLVASEWKYIPVRRLALFIEESLYRGIEWVVFEPNDESLWAEIRLSVGGFMHSLFRQGAFQGATAKEAYYVKCDAETTTKNDIRERIVNIVVGFAPLKPGEFVVLKIQQRAGEPPV